MDCPMQRVGCGLDFGSWSAASLRCSRCYPTGRARSAGGSQFSFVCKLLQNDWHIDHTLSEIKRRESVGMHTISRQTKIESNGAKRSIGELESLESLVVFLESPEQNNLSNKAVVRHHHRHRPEQSLQVVWKLCGGGRQSEIHAQKNESSVAGSDICLM